MALWHSLDKSHRRTSSPNFVQAQRFFRSTAWTCDHMRSFLQPDSCWMMLDGLCSDFTRWTLYDFVLDFIEGSSIKH